MMSVQIHDGETAYWVIKLLNTIGEFILIWAAVHAGNRTALKPIIEESEKKLEKMK